MESTWEYLYTGTPFPAFGPIAQIPLPGTMYFCPVAPDDPWGELTPRSYAYNARLVDNNSLTLNRLSEVLLSSQAGLLMDYRNRSLAHMPAEIANRHSKRFQVVYCDGRAAVQDHTPMLSDPNWQQSAFWRGVPLP